MCLTLSFLISYFGAKNQIAVSVIKDLAGGLPPFNMKLERNVIVSLPESFCEKNQLWVVLLLSLDAMESNQGWVKWSVWTSKFD